MASGWLSVVIAVATVTMACSDGADAGGDSGPVASASEATFIGAIDGSETRIAIVQGDREIQAYVCGQGATLDSHTRWFEGELRGADAGTLERALTLIEDDWQLRVSAAGNGLRGELRAPNGEALSWSAERTSDDPASEVGLFESDDTGCRSGVIVWGALDGPGCRAQGAWCDATGTRGQVTPADCTADEPLRVFGDDNGERIELVAERVHSR